MALCVGYLVAATGPWLLGAVHDASGNWTTPLVVLIVMTLAELMKPQKILGSAEERKSYLDELVKLYKAADEPVARRLDQVAHEHASMRQDYFAQNMELAQRGSVTTEEIQERMRKREEVEAVEARYHKAKSDYREVQLVLVGAASAAASSLENGEINIADIERRIRLAAEEADAAKRAKDQVGQ